VMDLIMHSQIKPAINQVETHPFNQQQVTAEFLKANDVQIESWGPFAEGRNDLFTNESLVSIADHHGKSVAQVALRWLIQRGVVAIPKSIHADRMAQNFDIFDFSLTDQEMAAIKTLDLEKEKKILENKGILHALRGKQDLEEAAGAYKDIDVVMAEQQDLVDIVVRLEPLAVIKG